MCGDVLSKVYMLVYLQFKSDFLKKIKKVNWDIGPSCHKLSNDSQPVDRRGNYHNNL